IDNSGEPGQERDYTDWDDIRGLADRAKQHDEPTNLRRMDEEFARLRETKAIPDAIWNAANEGGGKLPAARGRDIGGNGPGNEEPSRKLSGPLLDESATGETLFRSGSGNAGDEPRELQATGDSDRSTQRGGDEQAPKELPGSVLEKETPDERQEQPTPSEADRTETKAAPEKEVAVKRIPTSEIHFDPKRFQYKMGTDEQGATGLLKGRKWNDKFAGLISIWKDPADGKTYVVNGHHRVQLAKYNRVPSVNVQYLDVPNAEEARAVGALQNIADGRGTAMDAAKFFRDSGATQEALDKEGVSLGESTAANGLALARLDPSIFDKVVSGKIRPGRAVAIGNATDVPEQQEAILKLIDQREAKGRSVTDETINELARMAKGAGEHTEHQVDLFGSHAETRNLALEKAEVSSAMRSAIGQEKRDFSSVADESKASRLARAGNKINAGKNAVRAKSAEQALEVYDRLSSRAGPIDDILNRAAKELANGANPATVKRDAYEQARTALAEAIGGGADQSSSRVQEDPSAVEGASGQKNMFGEEEKAAKSSVTDTLRSGFLDPELFKRLFPDVAETMHNWLADDVTPGDEQRAMMRETRGEKDRTVARAMKQLETTQKNWRLRSRADSLKFFNAVESGKMDTLSDSDQKLAKVFKGAFDHMKADLQKLNPN